MRSWWKSEKKKGRQTMEEGRKFRNHISVVAEKVGAGTYALLAVLAGIFIQNAEELLDMSSSLLEDRRTLFGLLICLGLLAVSIVKTWWTWSRTWISVQDQAIVIEKRTVNGSENTIGIKNISNINLEQNLFEMLVGTCKVKMDTGSLSTANSTDVTIVLKKAKAEAFKAEVESLLRGEKERTEESETGDKEAYDFRAGSQDIIRHGICSMSVLSIVAVVLGLMGAVVMAAEALGDGDVFDSLLRSAVSFLAAIVIVLSAVWDIIKDFVRYLDFSVKRRKDRIYIRYGILKKVEYTIPVDMIQALKLRQTLIARIWGKYMAEIVNVGMGDDKGEKKSFLILYGSEQEVCEKLKLILPEFAAIAEREVKRQPRSVWAAWLWPLALYEACVAAAGGLASFWLPGYIPAEYMHLYHGAAAVGLILLAAAGPAVLAQRYRTSGMTMSGGFVKAASGCWGRTIVAARCDHIQYVTLRQNFIARSCGICKGTFHLLAGAGDMAQILPYFEAEQAERMREEMCDMGAGR